MGADIIGYRDPWTLYPYPRENMQQNTPGFGYKRQSDQLQAIEDLRGSSNPRSAFLIEEK